MPFLVDDIEGGKLFTTLRQAETYRDLLVAVSQSVEPIRELPLLDAVPTVRAVWKGIYHAPGGSRSRPNYGVVGTADDIFSWSTTYSTTEPVIVSRSITRASYADRYGARIEVDGPSLDDVLAEVRRLKSG